MKPVYSNITSVTGQLTTGICSLQIIPREWLAAPLEIDFSSNTILVEPAVADGRNWMDLILVDSTLAFSAKPKVSKAGSYYEIAISGMLNNLDADILQILETLRYHEFIAIVKDKLGRKRIAGDTDTGMTLQISQTETNNQGGTQTVGLDLFMISEQSPPFLID